MSKKPAVQSIDVNYRDAVPTRLTVPVTYDGGMGSFCETYVFKMSGSTTVFSAIYPDGGSYNWVEASDRREVAAEAVGELPFVQAVSMPG